MKKALIVIGLFIGIFIILLLIVGIGEKNKKQPTVEIDGQTLEITEDNSIIVEETPEIIEEDEDNSMNETPVISEDTQKINDIANEHGLDIKGDESIMSSDEDGNTAIISTIINDDGSTTEQKTIITKDGEVITEDYFPEPGVGEECEE